MTDMTGNVSIRRMTPADYDGALSILRKAASVEKTDECLLLMAECYENQGNYTKALQEQELAAVISKVLYPEDNHSEGKELRLKQHYFFTSA